MKFNNDRLSARKLSPSAVAMVDAVINTISSEEWFTDDDRKREEFAVYVTASYHRGLIEPEQLLRFCNELARRRFKKGA